MTPHLIVRLAAKLLVPCIALFALYVQFHGDFGPGGGFQAGVLLATACILYAMVFGANRLSGVISPTWIPSLAAAGVLLYALVGVVSLVRGSAYLDYDALSANPLAGQHLGILLIEFGVGLTVTAVIVGLFFAFTGKH